MPDGVERILLDDHRWLEIRNPDLDSEYRFTQEESIDELLEPTESFWHSLQIHCDSGCCGLAAFSFIPEHVIWASDTLPDSRLSARLCELKSRVLALPEKRLKSTHFNDTIDTEALVELLSHIIDTLAPPRLG